MAIVNDAYRDYSIAGGKQSLATFTTLYQVYGIDSVYAIPGGKVVSAIETLIQRYNAANPTRQLPFPVSQTTVTPAENPGGGSSTRDPNAGDTDAECRTPGYKIEGYYSTAVLRKDPIYGVDTPIVFKTRAECDAEFVKTGAPGIESCSPSCQDSGSVLPEQPQPQYESCCSQLSIVADGIVKALNTINETLNKRFNDVCDYVEKCTDKIISNINAKYKGIQKTCKQCQYEIANGLGGTLEYAITCAGKCYEQAEKECDNPPCPPKPEPKKEYIGYCDKATGLIYVLSADTGPPTATSVVVASGIDFDAVTLAAGEACRNQSYPTTQSPPDKPEQKPYPKAGSLICSVDQFISESLLNQWIDPSIGIGIAAAIVSTIDVAETAAMEGVQQYIPGYSLVAAGFRAAKLPIAVADAAADSIGSALGCSKPEWANVFRTLASLSYVESKTGVDLSDQKLPFAYALNGMCQHKQLGERDALAAYMSDCVTKDTFSKLWKIAGYCPDAIDAAEHIGQTRPIPNQLAAMRRRLLIDPEEYHRGMRKLGYLNRDQNDHLFRLTESLPGLSDIIRFMVRDADDDKIADRFGLDNQFADKYGKQLRQWAEWQGVPENVAKYAWRSHWQIPSPGQLFEFYHRLRYNDKFGKPGELLEDIRAALVQQDIMPFWQDHYLAVSFHPLTRVDARRGFTLGSMDEKQLKASFLDQGYSDDNADILVEFSKRQRVISAQGHRAIKRWVGFMIDRTQAYNIMVKDGLPGDVVNEALDNATDKFKSGEIANAFARGDLNRGMFIERLLLNGLTQDQSDKIADIVGYKITTSVPLKQFEAGLLSKQNAIDGSIVVGMAIGTAVILANEVESKVDQQLSLACQRGIRKRYLLGELTAEESTTELINHNVTGERSTKLIQSWGCEKKSLGKAIPTSKLCGWLERGVITVNDFIGRMINIGHSHDDAVRIVQDCLISVDAKRAKLAAKQAKDQQAQAAKAVKDAERNANATKRQIEAGVKAAAAAQKASVMRGKQLVAAAEKVVKNCGVELYDALQMVKTERDRVMAENPFTIDDTLQILLLAAEDYDCDVTTSYHDAVDLVASAFLPDDMAKA